MSNYAPATIYDRYCDEHRQLVIYELMSCVVGMNIVHVNFSVSIVNKQLESKWKIFLLEVEKGSKTGLHNKKMIDTWESDFANEKVIYEKNPNTEMPIKPDSSITKWVYDYTGKLIEYNTLTRLPIYNYSGLTVYHQNDFLNQVS